MAEELNTGEDEIEDSQPQTESEDSQGKTPADDEPKPAKGVQKRLNELTAARRDAERDRDYWRSLALKNQEKPKEAAPEVKATGQPKVDDYTSYDQYLEALADWKVDQKLQAREAQTAEAKTKSDKEAVQRTHFAREQKFRESHDDFDAVMNNPALAISESMVEAAFRSEKGPELLYYLGNNPEESARIANMHPYQAAMEMGRLEAALSQPTRNQTGAPEPIETVSGGGNTASVDPDKMSTEEWLKWRNQSLRK